jgi:hypothetical protein
MLTVTIEGKEHQVPAESVKAPEGWAIVTPDSDPSEVGLVRKTAMEAIIKDRVHQAKQSALKDAVNDESVGQAVLSKYGIALKDGKPIGVEGANIDEIKQTLHKDIKANLEREYAPIRKENNQIKGNLLRESIKTAAATSGVRKGLVEVIAGHTATSFGIDPEGGIYQKDGDGFKLDGNGERVTPAKYFEAAKKQSDYADWFDNTKQSGGYGGTGGTGIPATTTKKDLKTRDEKAAFINAYGLEAYTKLT